MDDLELSTFQEPPYKKNGTLTTVGIQHHNSGEAYRLIAGTATRM